MSQDLPKNWTKASLSRLVAPSGLADDGDWIESRDQDPDGDVQLVQLADIGDGQFLGRSNRFMRSTRARQLGCTFLEAGDILIARMPSPIGRACLFPSSQTASVTVVDVCIFRAGHDGIDHRWLVYALNSPPVRNCITNQSGGSTRRRIAGSKLRSIELPIPPVQDQKRIADELDFLFARCSQAEQHLREAAQSLSKFERALIRDAMCGRLTVGWRQRRKSTAGFAALPSRFSGAYSTPFPASWSWVSLGEVAEVQTGLAKGKRRSTSSVMRQVKYLRVANVQRGYLDLADVRSMEATDGELQTLRLKRGDILLNEGGDRDKLGRGWVWSGELEECIHQNHVFRARLHNSEIDPRIVSNFCNSHGADYFNRHAKQTVNLASISLSTLKGTPVPLIPMEEQLEILRIIEDQSAAVEEVRTILLQGLHSVTKIRQTLLERAVQGKLLPPDLALASSKVMVESLAASAATSIETRRNDRTRRTEVKPALKVAESQTEKLLVETIGEASNGLTPEQLFLNAGLKDFEVDRFFSALDILERNGSIKIDVDRIKAAVQ